MTKRTCDACGLKLGLYANPMGQAYIAQGWPQPPVKPIDQLIIPVDNKSVDICPACLGVWVEQCRRFFAKGYPASLNQ